MTACAYCGEAVDSADPLTYRRVVGWERKALSLSRRGGSDIVLREPSDEWAHSSCVERVRSGLSVKQGSLL